MYGKCLKHPLVLFSSQKYPNFTLKLPQKTKTKWNLSYGKEICHMPQKYNHDLVTLRPQTSNTCKKSTNEHKVIRKILQIFKKYTLLFQPFCYWILQCNKLLLTIYCRTLDVKSSPTLNFSRICHMRHQNFPYAPRRLRLRLRPRVR